LKECQKIPRKGIGIDYAIKIFQLNIEVFPENPSCGGLGEAFMIKGDKANAIKYYEKALELDPKMETSIEALKKLRN
jgi:tetratricopeptide (TPR) repeat protein